MCVFEYLFILSKREQRERERECVCVCVQVQGRGRERIPSRLHAVSTELEAGLELTNHEIMT